MFGFLLLFDFTFVRLSFPGGEWSSLFLLPAAVSTGWLSVTFPTAALYIYYHSIPRRGISLSDHDFLGSNVISIDEAEHIDTRRGMDGLVDAAVDGLAA